MSIPPTLRYPATLAEAWAALLEKDRALLALDDRLSLLEGLESRRQRGLEVPDALAGPLSGSLRTPPHGVPLSDPIRTPPHGSPLPPIPPASVVALDAATEARIAALEAGIRERDALIECYRETIAYQERRIASLEARNRALEAENAALRSRIRAQDEKIAALEQSIASLLERLGKDSSNSSRPPSSDPPWKPKRRPPTPPSGRKPGGQPGHPGRFRALFPPEQVSEIREHRPETCDQCGLPLDPTTAPEDTIFQQTVDLPPPRLTVVEDRRHRLRCACGHVTTAQTPLGTPPGPVGYGPRLEATVAAWNARQRLSTRAISALLRDLYALPMSIGAVSSVLNRASVAVVGAVEAIRTSLDAAPANHLDETSWRVNRAPATLWGRTGGHFALYRIDRRRDRHALNRILPAEYAGFVHSDRFGVYSQIPLGQRQYCWAHLRRDFQANVDRKGLGEATAKALLALSDRIFALRAQERSTEASPGTSAGVGDSWDSIRQDWSRILASGQRCGDAKVESLCRRLRELDPALWAFSTPAGIAAGLQPTNNDVEQALRHPVLLRKSSLGSASAGGALALSRLLSVTETIRRHGGRLIEWLTAAIGAHREGRPAPAITAPGPPPTPARSTRLPVNARGHRWGG